MEGHEAYKYILWPEWGGFWMWTLVVRDHVALQNWKDRQFWTQEEGSNKSVVLEGNVVMLGVITEKE